ncbi:hypothetical protein COOONC_02605 [Cooperia oncophora]
MADRPSSSSVSSLKTAISSINEVHSSASTLNEDIRELLEQVEIVEKLPQSINLAQIDGWRSSDLLIVEDFLREAHRIASNNVLISSNIRIAIPAVPYNVDSAIARLIFDIKTLDAQ